jgi:hypothetical protein
MQSTIKTRRRDARKLIADTWQTQANLSVFLAMVVLIGFVLPAVGFESGDLRLYSNVSFSFLLISGVAIAWGRRVLFLPAAALAVVTLLVRWVALAKATPAWDLRSDYWSLAAIILIAVVLLDQVFREGPVRSARVQGAIAVYLLFGVAWAHAYRIAETHHPGSFHHAAGELATIGDWIYYSFVTLTTVGYGDITPATAITRNLSIGEALAGQLFLAVLIARLVAMEVMNWQQRANGSSDN